MVTGEGMDVFRRIFFWLGGVTWEDITMGEEDFNEGSAGFSSII